MDDIFLKPDRTENTEGQFYVFEIRSEKAIYYCGDPMNIQSAREWEFVIRQTLKQQRTKTTQDKSSQQTANDSSIVNQSQTRTNGTVNTNNSAKKDVPSDEMDMEYQIFVEVLLGSGQFGQVFVGAHKSTGEEVAIKVIDKHRFPQKQEEQLKNEVNFLGGIRHPGVVAFKHMYEDSTKIFVVMEKLDGDMLELINGEGRPGTLKELNTKFIIYQVNFLNLHTFCVY